MNNWELELEWESKPTPEETVAVNKLVETMLDDVNGQAEQIPACVRSFKFSKIT